MVGCDESEWGRRTAEGMLLEGVEVRAPLQPVFHWWWLVIHSGHVGTAVRSTKWEYAMSDRQHLLGVGREDSEWG